MVRDGKLILKFASRKQIKMAYFIVYALDDIDKNQERLDNRPAHRVRLREHSFPLKIHIAGPMLDENEQMIGTMLIVEAIKKKRL